MKIIKKVIVKQILTPTSKQRLTANFQKEKVQLEQECQQLNFEKRKLMQRTHLSKESIEKKFAMEIKKREEKMALIDFKLSQLERLNYGAEIVETEVDALVEVELGMNWYEQMQQQAIIIKDGIVIKIENV
ncbi:MAG TPA: YlqD family protein [Bacillota bacterium]|nr:YlqD family protein [Bacillota bacterium]